MARLHVVAEYTRNELKRYLEEKADAIFEKIHISVEGVRALKENDAKFQKGLLSLIKRLTTPKK